VRPCTAKNTRQRSGRQRHLCRASSENRTVKALPCDLALPCAAPSFAVRHPLPCGRLCRAPPLQAAPEREILSHRHFSPILATGPAMEGNTDLLQHPAPPVVIPPPLFGHCRAARGRTKSNCQYRDHIIEVEEHSPELMWRQHTRRRRPPWLQGVRHRRSRRLPYSRPVLCRRLMRVPSKRSSSRAQATILCCCVQRLIQGAQ
jgi:hypothetical protein